MFRTSKLNFINIHGPTESIVFDTDEPFMKQGTRLNGKGDLSVITTNADADIFFDI